MGELTAVLATPARGDSGEVGIEVLLRHVSSVVGEIEQFKAERQAEAIRAARARLTIVHADKRSPKRRTA